MAKVNKSLVEKQKKINTYKNVIIVILLVIIALLLLHDCEGRKGKDLKDNYDIYELDCECDEPIEEDPEKEIKDPDKPSNPDKPDKPSNPDSGNSGNNNSNNSNSNNNNSNSGNKNEGGQSNNKTPEETTPEDNSEDEDTELEIGDSEEGLWSTTSQVHVFRNPLYEMNEIIAPGSTNSYKFYIRNKKDCNILYKLEFSEDNPYGVNMKYKLKDKEGYIISNWVSYNELVTAARTLNAHQEEEYTLEWLWQHNDSQDTNIGKNIDAYYKLNITIYGEQVS